MKQVVEGGGMFILLLRSCSGMDEHNEFKCFLIPKRPFSPNFLKIFSCLSWTLTFCIYDQFKCSVHSWFHAFGGKSELQPVSEPRSASGILTKDKLSSKVSKNCHIKLLWGVLFDWHEFKAATTRQTSTKYSYVIVTVIVLASYCQMLFGPYLNASINLKPKIRSEMDVVLQYKGLLMDLT